MTDLEKLVEAILTSLKRVLNLPFWLVGIVKNIILNLLRSIIEGNSPKK